MRVPRLLFGWMDDDDKVDDWSNETFFMNVEDVHFHISCFILSQPI